MLAASAVGWRSAVIAVGCTATRTVEIRGGIRVHVVCARPGKRAHGTVRCADHFPKVIE